MELTFTLPLFEGPLDLLLHLITQHKLDIYDIPLTLLLRQYLDYLDNMRRMDLDVASEFLEMAARLVYIKTASMLPRYEEADELKKELTGELLEFKAYKDAAAGLQARAGGFRSYVRAPLPLRWDHPYGEIHEPEELHAAYLSAVGRGERRLPPPVDSFQGIAAREPVTVSSRIVFLLRTLRRGAARLAALFEGCRGKSEMVATFLGLLELMKARRVTVNESESVQLVGKEDFP